MTRHLFSRTLSLFLLLLSVVSAGAAEEEGLPGDGLAGDWMGVLAVGGARLRLALHVEQGADEALAGKVVSIDQGNVELAIDKIAFADRSLEFEIGGVGGKYAGTMKEDGSAVEGTWSQGGSKFPLTFRRTAAPFALKRPQEPKPPFPYESEDVKFRNEEAGLELAGTMITPPGEGPFPAVVFLSGSGPQDRDESLMGHKPFLVVADYLARRGIASLRFDDRGFGESEGDHMASTTTDFAKDAEAAAEFLAGQKSMDENAIGVIGHSEGGLSGPRAASSNDVFDYLVLLAPPGEPLVDLVDRQARDAYAATGLDPDLVNRALAKRRKTLEIIRDEEIDREALKEKLRARSQELIKEFTEEELTQLEYDEAAEEREISLLTTPWFRSLLREDPGLHLAKLKIPVFALFAEKDVQVDAGVNHPIVEKALAKSESSDYRIVTLPGLNHLFQHADTGAISEYGEIEETFAPEALELIGDWIVERFGRE